eukprot:8297126-Pyramimonas_sp.AAC.1
MLATPAFTRSVALFASVPLWSGQRRSSRTCCRSEACGRHGCHRLLMPMYPGRVRSGLDWRKGIQSSFV